MTIETAFPLAATIQTTSPLSATIETTSPLSGGIEGGPPYTPAEWQTLVDLMNWVNHCLGRQKVFYSRVEGPLFFLDQVARALDTGQLCSRQEWEALYRNGQGSEDEG